MSYTKNDVEKYIDTYVLCKFDYNKLEDKDFTKLNIRYNVHTKDYIENILKNIICGNFYKIIEAKNSVTGLNYNKYTDITSNMYEFMIGVQINDYVLSLNLEDFSKFFELITKKELRKKKISKITKVD